MEWLINHPEEPAAAAAAPAPVAAPSEQITGVAKSISSSPAQALLKPKPEALTTQQLVDGAISVIDRVPNAVFSVADLLTSHIKQSKPEEQNALVEGLLSHLRGPTGAADAVRDRSRSLLAPAHLLAVLCADEAPLHDIVLHEGGIGFEHTWDV